MPLTTTTRRLAAALFLALAGSGAALAHHGWSWAEGELTRLTGTITAIVIAPPHPTLSVRMEDGVEWTVELGNPGRTQRSGFVEGVTAPGDIVTVLGNRAMGSAEPRIKAVRITIEGRDFDMYPERIPPGS